MCVNEMYTHIHIQKRSLLLTDNWMECGRLHHFLSVFFGAVVSKNDLQ